MIVFDLRCPEGHVAEAWFGSSADYEAQKARGLLSCPVCDSPDVEKAVMAPAVAAKSNRAASFAGIREAMARLRQALETGCDYVGADFAAEARARHERGQSGRGVWGEASLEEVQGLVLDGIPVLPLPFRPGRKLDG